MYYVTDIFLPSRMMRDTVSGLELLGLHSYSPLCLMSTLAMDTVDQDTCSPTWVVTTQLRSCVTGKGWWLKYQKMWWGGSGDNTVQLMECEEPTLRYTDFSPTIAHRGSEVTLLKLSSRCGPGLTKDRQMYSVTNMRWRIDLTFIPAGVCHCRILHNKILYSLHHPHRVMEQLTTMLRDHRLWAGAMSTPILLSPLNTNWPTASRPGSDMLRSLTHDTFKTLYQDNLWPDQGEWMFSPFSCLHCRWYSEDELCCQLTQRRSARICQRRLLEEQEKTCLHPAPRENSNPSLLGIVLLKPDLLMLFHLNKLKRSKWSQIKTFFLLGLNQSAASNF